MPGFCRRDGKTWGAPIAVDPVVMFYNKDRFNLYNTPYRQPGGFGATIRPYLRSRLATKLA